MARKYEYLRPLTIIMDEAGVKPPLVHQKLHLIMQAGLVRGRQGEQHHAHVHSEAVLHGGLYALVIPIGDRLKLCYADSICTDLCL